MATVQMYADRKAVSARTIPAPAFSESVADRVLTGAAMIGALAGAVGGVTLGVQVDTAFPVAWGMFGTMLGSGLAAGGWCSLARLWAGHEKRDAART